MSTYRYATTDLLTGALQADTLPLRVTSFGRNLGGVGQPGRLTGSLDLGALPAAQQAFLLGALEPRRNVLWVLQDGYPVWAGIVWDWDHQSAASNRVTVIADELPSLFAKRQVRTDQVFTTQDLLLIVRGLLTYTLSKASGGVAALQLGTTGSTGVGAAITFKAATTPTILDCLTQMATQYGFEYAFTPTWGAGVPQIQLQVGYPTLGRPAASSNLRLEYPGNAIDYSFPRTGSASVNSLLGTAAAAGSVPWQSGAAHGQNPVDIANGFPLLEASAALTTANVGSQAQIDAFADGRVAALAGCATIPSVVIAGGGSLTVGQIQLGDEAVLAATSSLHPADPTTGAPGLQQVVRIIGWTVTPPDGDQAESTVLHLGGVTT